MKNFLINCVISDNEWLSSQDLNKIAKNHGIEHATKLKRLQDSMRKLDNFFKYYE